MQSSLDNLERWLQDAIVRPLERGATPAGADSADVARPADAESVDAAPPTGAESAGAARPVDAARPTGAARPTDAARPTGAARSVDAASNILPSRHLAPRERIAIYSGMYVSRLHECLEVDFPALARFLGPEPFGRLVRAYLRKFPSRHYSLNVLGRHMTEFLEGDVKFPRRALLADIARLELAMSEVFDEEGSETLSPADLATLNPAEWAGMRVKLVPALRLHAFAHRTNAIVTALRQEQSLPDLRRRPTWVVVYRKDWVVWRMDLSRSMFEILSVLKQGEPLSHALAVGASHFEGSIEELQASVARWFSEWTAEGFYAAIERAQ